MNLTAQRQIKQRAMDAVAEFNTSGGTANVKELCRKYDISDPTFYKYRGMAVGTKNPPCKTPVVQAREQLENLNTQIRTLTEARTKFINDLTGLLNDVQQI